jgi:hypothetical protein
MLRKTINDHRLAAVCQYDMTSKINSTVMNDDELEAMMCLNFPEFYKLYKL